MLLKKCLRYFLPRLPSLQRQHLLQSSCLIVIDDELGAFRCLLQEPIKVYWNLGDGPFEAFDTDVALVFDRDTACRRETMALLKKIRCVQV